MKVTAMAKRYQDKSGADTRKLSTKKKMFSTRLVLEKAANNVN
jgi:hypothetical protein